jgi:hypothetical protein
MTEPASTPLPEEAAPAAPTGSAPSERGWGRLLLAFVAFVLVPMIPQVRAIVPIEQTMVLFVPALAACALVGWWAGGRAFLAIAWVAIAVLMMTARTGATPDAFDNLARGWSLLLAGSFGLVCLVSGRRPFFARALTALAMTLCLALVMSLLGPVTMSRASQTVATEFTHRNREFLGTLDSLIQAHPKEWQDLTTKMPQLAGMPAQTQQALTAISSAGRVVFPALLALESLAALALAWATYHRFSRARLGAPLRPLRDFRFNDQLVWGLIVGLTIMLLPTLTALSGVGKNLLVFFGALYALRGLGVLSWFMKPGSLGVTLSIGLVLLAAPFVNVVVALGFMLLGGTALALGLGDTWADWRSRARHTSS